MGIHLLTFAGEFIPRKYTFASLNLKKMAEEFNLFDTITIYTHETLNHFPDFLEKHLTFVVNNKRGFGYWIWKAFIIHKHLSSLKEGDILLYVDACTFLNIGAKDRFLEYIEMVKKNKDGNLFFEYTNIISDWCKVDTLVALNAVHLFNEKEVVSNVIFTTANKKNIDFFKMMYEISCNYHLLDDSPSILPNSPRYKEHRHDQSLFSILTRLLLPDSISTNPNSDDINFYKRDNLRPLFPIWIQSNMY
jgi:hypothetical protein